MSEITIRDFKKSEADRLANFFHTEWRENHILYRSRELLMWMYHDNPYAPAGGELLTCKAAFCDDEVIGILCYMPCAFNRYGQKQRGCNMSAWWTHEDHRKGGLGLKLMRKSIIREMNLDAAIAGMLTKMVQPVYTAMRWVTVWNIPRLLLPLDKDRMIAMAEADSSDCAATVRQKLESVKVAHPLATSTDITVTELSSLAELPARLWDKFYWDTIAPTHMAPAREAKYLQWRFGDIPIFKYRTLAAKRDGQIVGLLVFRVEQVRSRSEKIVRIVDFVAGAGAADALARAVAEKAREQQAVLVDFFCTHRRYNTALKKAGFIDATTNDGQDYWFPYLFQPMDFGYTKLNCAWWLRDMDLKTHEARSDFVLMKGDYEFDRPN